MRSDFELRTEHPPSLGERPCRIRELTVDDPPYPYPISNAKIELKAHQRSLLQRCLYMENVGVPFDDDLSQEGRYKHVKTNIGILGDKVGSGKSFTILALMLVNPQPLIKYTKTFVYANGHVAFKMRADESVVCADVNVVVVPHTIARQWMSYVRAFSDDFVPLLINSNKVFETLDDALSKVNLVVVTCNFYRSLSAYLADRKMQVRRVVFDEVDTAQTPNAKRANAKFYWFVSASYQNVLDPFPRWVFNYDARPASRQISTGIVNNAFAKNIFATLCKTVSAADQRYVERIVVKSADDFVERSFDLPDPQAHHIVCTSPVEIDILSGITNKNIVRSLNAGDVVTAISYISPSNVNTEDNIVVAVRRDFDMRLANVHVRLAMARDLIYKNESVRSRSIAKVERERNELLEKIKLIEERVRTADVCCVCYSAFHTKTVTKCCKNSFCLGCISTWLTEHNTCPMCKAHCAHGSFFVVHDQPTDVSTGETSRPDPPRPAPKTKLDALREIVSRDAARKLIVFSEYDHAFDSIREVLRELDVRHEMLKGSSVSKVVELYRSTSDLRVLLVNPRWSGVGLNLENTTDVVIYHSVAPQMEKQIVGRAHRPGRESALRVWHLRYPNEDGA